jgi:hypothetical protein
MAYLAEILLFLAPFGIVLLWQRLAPGATPRTATPWLAAAGLACAMAGAVWYGFTVRQGEHADYQPARLGADGRIIPGQSSP